MRIHILITALLATLTCSPTLTTAGVALEYTGGLAVPVGELNGFYNPGISFGASMVVALVPHLDIAASAGYGKVVLSEEAVQEHLHISDYQLASGGDVSAQSIGAELRLSFGAPGEFQFWGLGGLGHYRVRISDRTEIIGGDRMTYNFPDENQLGSVLGAGFTYPALEGLELGAEVRAHMFSLENELRVNRVDESRTMLTIRFMVRTPL
ncbi:hypothetical protein KDM41_05955 [bacterium]|nr:hypothetical protein [bacterium]